ncbi:threonine synthase [Halothermothrix orenii]|uniref:Threonine synthase n=1 Tax=Halothermothrix orenii (strain H 168 / OCM 544 / DSM 9562) TaxID=373903 RepID=B8CW91_HALOH|nr:threonine synthase [Halothermothrix orenii]ACL69560.1 threonine synthase [Halothermothrix orenii H 168]
MKKWPGIIEAYREFMPLKETTKPVTLQEGNTPLIYADRLSEKLGIQLYLKYDGANPTGSFKDRGMTLAVTKAIEDGSEAIMCASTGNTSAAAAAYGARSGLKTAVVIPEGKIALGKLAQALMHGAEVIPIKGNFDDALAIVKEITSKYPITLVNSLNPYRIEGQKSGAFEVCDQLGNAPDVLAIPVGNAGNITAYWKGFKEYYRAKKIESLPRMLGFEAEGSAAIAKNTVISEPETIATAIRIGNPASWDKAVKAAEESRGLIDYVTDNEIIETYREIASEVGIFAEPASAASVAGVKKMVARSVIKPGSQVVAVLTGHGLKDPTTAIDTIKKPEPVSAEVEAVLEKMGTW